MSDMVQTNSQEMITLSHISKKYQTEPALRDISFRVGKGEILGFLGPSGAGKTTTIKILTGQLRQTSGDAYILGRNTKEIDSSIYEQIGIVTDNSGIYENMTVYDNLKYFARILNVDQGRIEELLKRAGLWEHRKKQAGKLSKGQTQRLVLMRSVLHQPQILFLDEPTSGLDPSTAQEIHGLLKEQRDKGMAIFLTTHNMEEAAKLCDRVALLNDGNIVEIGTPREICLKYNTKKHYRILLKNQEEFVLEHNGENIQKIAAYMSDGELEVIHSCEPTLEDVFLAVTGRELR
ncbi:MULTISPECIES: ABC transporter ATP-binding protein [Clostridia]|uniref:ABC transporter ATP-binding protein n=1 Tax=Clostridia TaxID=186801 RepID=UPI001FAAE2C9|nr:MULTISPECIES: ABC transporter ATP-binding protein [Clostridia]